MYFASTEAIHIHMCFLIKVYMYMYMYSTCRLGYLDDTTWFSCEMVGCVTTEGQYENETFVKRPPEGEREGGWGGGGGGGRERERDEIIH